MGANTGILDWYTILTGVIALVTLTAHGSLYIAVKTEDELSQRVRTVALWAWPLQLILTIVGLIATCYVRPMVLDNYKQHAIGYLIPVVVFGSLAVMIYAIRKGLDKLAFVGSALYIVGMLVGAAFALYPVVLPASTDPAYNLTIYNTAAGTPWPNRRPHVVDHRDGSGSGILHLPVPHVSGESAAGRRRLLRHPPHPCIIESSSN